VTWGRRPGPPAPLPELVARLLVALISLYAVAITVHCH
jgi:hypothetical protein